MIKFVSRLFSLSIILGRLNFSLFAENSDKLYGTIISDASSSTTNPATYAFDNDESTFYMSAQASLAWVGYDLGTPHVIQSIRWKNLAGTYQMQYYVPWFYKKVNMPYSFFAVFEGANSPDFHDAVPLYMITDPTEESSWQEVQITTTRGFRYVRYVGPNSSHAQICELEFYGSEGIGDDTHFYQLTNLPLVSVHVNSGKEPVNKTDELLSYCTIVSNSGSKMLEDTCTFRLRGNSSMEYAKKPYRLKFDQKHKVPGADYKAKKWTLIPNLDDKSLIRNYIGFEANRAVGLEYTPFCSSVDLIVNGEYKGNYQLCDQVEANKNRIDIEEIVSENHSSPDQFGWFIEIDKLASKESKGTWFNSSKGIPVTVKSPDNKEINSEYLSGIKRHFDLFEEAVYNGEIDTISGYRHFLDMNSFIRYVIASEFVVNSDAYHSIFLHKHVDDDHFYVGPIWDLNLSLNNDSRFYDVNKRTRWSFYESSADAGTIRTLLLNMFDSDSGFLQEMKDAWANLRQTKAFTTDRFISLVDSLSEVLQESQSLNFKRWDVISTKICQNKYTYYTYDGEIDALKEALYGRVSWMDDMLNCKQGIVNITISEAGWSTIYIPYSFSIPEGLACYTVAGIVEDKLQLEKVVVTEANKPYLLHGPVGDYSIVGYETDACDERHNGLLVGTQNGLIAPIGSYVLQNQNGTVSFYRVEETIRPDIPEQKAYLLLLDSLFIDDLTTPNSLLLYEETIEGLSFNREESVNSYRIYNLSGNLLLTLSAEETEISSIIVNMFGHGMYIIVNGLNSRTIQL